MFVTQKVDIYLYSYPANQILINIVYGVRNDDKDTRLNIKYYNNIQTSLNVNFTHRKSNKTVVIYRKSCIEFLTYSIRHIIIV